MKIFIPVVGQFVNIGDTLHRKILISWLKEIDTELHVFVGNAPDSFIEALGLRTNDKIYRSYFLWSSSMFFNSLTNKINFVFNPGELTMSKKRLVLEIALTPLHFFIKLRKGNIIRVGVAAKSDIQIQHKKIWKKILSFSNRIYWRTFLSRDFFGLGKTIPDLAFYDVDTDISFTERSKLVISMRGDRPAPDEKWYESIKEFANNNDLEIIVVSQVLIDNKRTIEIGERLMAKCYIWESNYSHNQQEIILNSLYRNSIMAISDRLHVLIAAFTKGVIPVNLAVTYSKKVEDHFSVIELGDVSIKSVDFEKYEIVDLLQKHKDKMFNLNLLINAKNTLDGVKKDVLKTLLST